MSQNTHDFQVGETVVVDGKTGVVKRIIPGTVTPSFTIYDNVTVEASDGSWRVAVPAIDVRREI